MDAEYEWWISLGKLLLFEVGANSVFNMPFTDNKSFFVVSMSDYGAQIYELMAQTVSEQKT